MSKENSKKGMKKGEEYICDCCGMVIKIENPCNCVHTCTCGCDDCKCWSFMCCGKPLRKEG